MRTSSRFATDHFRFQARAYPPRVGAHDRNLITIGPGSPGDQPDGFAFAGEPPTALAGSAPSRYLSAVKLTSGQAFFHVLNRATCAAVGLSISGTSGRALRALGPSRGHRVNR